MVKRILICAPVLLNLLNSLRKGNKMLGKPRILSLFPNSFNKFTHVRTSIQASTGDFRTYRICPKASFADITSMARSQNFGQSLSTPITLCTLYVRSECSEKSAHLCRFIRALPACICKIASAGSYVKLQLFSYPEVETFEY